MDIKGLKPGDAIAKFIVQEVYPAVEPYGFKLHKNLSMVRHVENYKQEIWIEKSKWNGTDQVVLFDVRFHTISKTFKKWYILFYKTPKEKHIFIPDGGGGGGIPSAKNWNHELIPYNYGFDLMTLDHQVLAKFLRENLVNAVIPELDKLSNYKNIVDIENNNSYGSYPYYIDICLEKNDVELSKAMIAKFDAFLPTYTGRRDEPYPQEVIDEINMRREIIATLETAAH